MNHTERYLEKNVFPKNAVVLYEKSLELTAHGGNNSSELRVLCEKIVHSILFFGNIQEERFTPCDIFGNLKDEIETEFPKPFKYYKSHLPLKTPFSYFLDLVVKSCNQDDEDRVKRLLSETLRMCNRSGDQYPLISVAICICESGESRYYGASLSCLHAQERKMMTSVSCLHVWHEKISSAVMSVFPDDTGETRNVRLPDTVTCRAYAVSKIEKLKQPCGRCSQLYSLPNPDPTDTNFRNPPGNCAETEAISNLLHAQKDVADQTIITGGVYEHTERTQRMLKCFNDGDMYPYILPTRLLTLYDHETEIS